VTSEVEKARIQATADFNAFVEHFFNQMGKLPSQERIRLEFPKMPARDVKTNISIAAVKLTAKGYNVTRREYLSPEQIAVANSLMNLEDKRSRSKKLQDFGVSTATFGNWKKDPAFNAYLRERGEALLGNSIGEVHLALIDAASSGDVSAMKLFYEITGRHTPGSRQDINVQAMLVQVIEAVQKHVSDPKILQAIATEIQENTGGMIIRGELEK
jgi:hypothetical protein